MEPKKSFHPYAAVTIFLWSVAYVLTRLALRHFSALSLGFLRYGVAAALLLVVCLVKKIPLPARKDVPWFIVSGVAGFFLYMIAFNVGTSYVTAATSSMIIASVPVLTALFAALLFRERLRRPQWAAIALEFVGILILTLYGAVFTANVGALWLLLAALLLSGYNLLQRKLTQRYSALQSTAYSIFVGAVLLAVFAPQAVSELPDAPAMQIVYILILGVFSSAIAYITWSKALERAERTSQVSNYMFFTPFLTAILGFLLAGELPPSSTWIGGAFILAGALTFNLAGRQPGEAGQGPGGRGKAR